MHRSPGGVTCEASFPARHPGASSEDATPDPMGVARSRRDTSPAGIPATRPYTPAMGRWVCIVALLAGFAGDDYVRGIRLREPVAVERVIARRQRGTHGLVPTGAWWSRPIG
jgi:hypothetical protein